MRPVLPVAIDWPVTLGAQQLRLVPGYFTSHVVDEHVSVDGMVAVETASIDPVIQANLGVLSQRWLRLSGRGQDVVTAAAFVGVNTRGVDRSQLRRLTDTMKNNAFNIYARSGEKGFSNYLAASVAAINSWDKNRDSYSDLGNKLTREANKYLYG